MQLLPHDDKGKAEHEFQFHDDKLIGIYVK